MLQNQHKASTNKSNATRQKLYSGFSLFGVPYNEIDIRYAAEQLFDIYSNVTVYPPAMHQCLAEARQGGRIVYHKR